jgi:cation diffusion facilitator family transporter
MHQESKKAVMAALVGNLAIAVFKFAAAFISRSSSMLAEAYHSVSDTLNQVLLLYGLRKCQKAPDKQHPFGHGKEQFFWSFMVAVILFGVAGSLSLKEGYHKIMHPEAIRHPMLNYLAIAVAVFFESYAFSMAYRNLKIEMKTENYSSYFETLRKSKNPTILTVFFEDLLALIGLFIALAALILVQITGLMILDGIASICIGILLMVFAGFLAFETKNLLVGEAVSPSNRQKIIESVTSFSEIESLISLKTMHLSARDVLVALELEYRDDITAKEMEILNDRLEAVIKEILPKAKVYLEAENAPPPKAC